MTFDDIKANIAEKIEFGRYVVQTFSNNVEEIANYRFRVVTLYFGDKKEVEALYLGDENTIEIHTFFDDEPKAAKDPELESMIEVLATVLYDLMDLWGDDAWLEWLGDE